ncbi:MAG: Ig domain-containing protein [Gemmatimonadaceae bacterium]
MTSRPIARPNLVRRLARLAALALLGVGCRDRAPVGPGLPSHAALAIAPQLQRAAQAGGPSFVSIKSVRGVLTPAGGGEPYVVDANFVGDTATLEFNVTFAGGTQRYTLALAAADTAGDTLFRSLRDVVASTGDNSPVTDIMTWIAPDTSVRTIFLLPADSVVLSGDTLGVTATGIDAREATITPLYIGWTSRDTNVATVISSGPSSARVIGRSIESPVWIVGRTFNGTADSVTVRVALKVASVTLAADTVHVVAGTVATTSATVTDALGTILDRPVSFTTLDPKIATVSTLLGVAVARGAAAPRTGAQVAPAVAQVTGVSMGTTQLIAESGGRADTTVIVVDPGPVAMVRIIPDSVAILARDSIRFAVLLLDANGDTLTGRKVSWATDSSFVTTIDASGMVRGTSVGRSLVTATAEGITDTAVVNVVTTGTSIVRTVVSPKTLHLLSPGERGQLVAQGYAGDSSQVPGRYTWSVRQPLPLLSLDSLGGVTALAVGTAWVIATEKGGTADSAQVTVGQAAQAAPVTSARVRGADAAARTSRRSYRAGNAIVAPSRPLGVAVTRRPSR